MSPHTLTAQRILQHSVIPTKVVELQFYPPSTLPRLTVTWVCCDVCHMGERGEGSCECMSVCVCVCLCVTACVCVCLCVYLNTAVA